MFRDCSGFFSRVAVGPETRCVIYGTFAISGLRIEEKADQDCRNGHVAEARPGFPSVRHLKGVCRRSTTTETGAWLRPGLVTKCEALEGRESPILCVSESKFQPKLCVSKSKFSLSVCRIRC